MNKKVAIFYFVLLAMLLLASCSNIAGGNSGFNIDGSKATTEMFTIVSNAKSICSSFISVDKDSSCNNTRAATADTNEDNAVQTVSYFDKGVLKPFVFHNRKTGKTLLLALHNSSGHRNYNPHVVKISNHSIAFCYDTIYEIKKTDKVESGYLISNPKQVWGWHGKKQALLDLNTGNFYDFDQYDFRNISSNEDYIFAFGQRSRQENSDTIENTFYKIDVNTLIAKPLNNPKFNPINSSEKISIIDDDRILVSNDKESYILFIKSDRPKCPLSGFNFNPTSLQASYHSLNNKSFHHPLLMQDKNGQLYIFAIGSRNSTNYHGDMYLTGKVTLDTSEEGKPASFIITDIEEKPVPETFGHSDDYMTFNKNPNL